MGQSYSSGLRETHSVTCGLAIPVFNEGYAASSGESLTGHDSRLKPSAWVGPYTIQAAIAAVHAQSPSPAATN
jgi:hypothetical protein